MKTSIKLGNTEIKDADLQFVYPLTRDKRVVVELGRHPSLLPLIVGETYTLPDLGNLQDLQLKQVAWKSKADGQGFCGLERDRWVELQFGLPGLLFNKDDWSGEMYEIFPDGNQFQLREGGDAFELVFLDLVDAGTRASIHRVLQDGITLQKTLGEPLFRGFRSTTAGKSPMWYFVCGDVERCASNPFVGAARMLLNIL